MAEETMHMVVAACHELVAIPDELHLLCPRVADDDEEDYDSLDEPGEIGLAEKQRRIQNWKTRSDLTYKCSMILGFNEENAGQLQDKFKARTSCYFTTCAGCVRNWHKNRKGFLHQLSEHEPDAVVTEMAELLYKFDSERITNGLRGATAFIENHDGVVNQKTFMDEDQSCLLISLYEALCCVQYVRQSEFRSGDMQSQGHFGWVFEKIQEKRPLRLGELLPSMTMFLFADDRISYNFAKTCYARLSNITLDDFEWAVKEELERPLQKVAMMNAPSGQLQRFWEGLAIILNTLNKDVVVQALGSLNTQPCVYQTMLNHMAIDSEDNLAVILKVFCIILQKGPRGLWMTFANFSPTAVAEQVFASPAYRRLLNQTAHFSNILPEDDSLRGPVATAWIMPLIESIPVSQKGDACDALVHQLLDKILHEHAISQEGKAVCCRGAAEALMTTLSAFLAPGFRLHAGSSTIHTNRILNLTIKHKGVLIALTQMHLVNPQETTISETATNVIGSALMLDSRVTAEEFNGYLTGDHHVQTEVTRSSSDLWEAFLELLVPGAKIARSMLLATVPFMSAETLRSDKKREPLSKPKQVFNAQYQKSAAVIGSMIGRLAEFDASQVAQLCQDTRTLKPILAALISGEDSIREAAVQFVKTVTDEMGRTDAILRLLELYYSPALAAFTQAVNDVTSMGNKLWLPQQQIINLSEDVLKSLSDPADGILRAKVLDGGERTILMKWWESQWTFLAAAFDGLDPWSKAIDIEIMKLFCRSTMALAESLLSQDGLISSALGSQSMNTYLFGTDDSSKEALKKILHMPCQMSLPMARMLRLKDRQLIEITVNIMVKLLQRLKDYDIALPEETLNFIRNTGTKGKDGKFIIATNLTAQQRAELMRFLDGDDDDEVELLTSRPVFLPKKQSNLDAWSKSADDVSITSSKAVSSDSSRSHSREVSREPKQAAGKVRSTLDLTKARLQAQSRPSVVKELKTATKSEPRNNLTAQKIKESRQRELEAKKQRDAEAIRRAQALRAPKPLMAGEGSGAQGLLGAKGKDQGPEKSEMLVGDSSEDEDSGEEAAFLAQTKAGQKRNEDSIKRVQELKQQMKARGPVKKQKVQRSKKDLRARLIPPMDVLHQAILDWDIFHDSEDPPNGVDCVRVTNSFENPVQYKKTFLPLLVYEAWQGFRRDKDETTPKPFGIKVMNRATVDRFIEVTTAMTEIKDRFMAEGDIVLLSTAPNPLDGREDPHCLARISRVIMKQGALEVTYRINRSGPILNQLHASAELYGEKITNMKTIEREYAALESLQYYDLMQEIIEAKPSPILELNAQTIQNLADNYKLNQGQAKAVLHARENDGFTLIQGPPGTGKTKTIIALVGSLLTGHFNVTANHTVIKNPGVPAANAVKQSTSKKLLVCAPSNAAVDELVLRFKSGVKASTGAFHKINVIRMGRSDAANAAVKDVTLEELVNKKLEASGQKDAPTERQKMHEEAGHIKKQLTELRPRLEAARKEEDRAEINQLQRKFDELKRLQTHVGAKIDADKQSGNSAARENEVRRRQVQQEIIDSAHILCCTLSSSGHEMFKNLSIEFETVIIDEAAQCVELSAIIPLKYGCSKCILVGDPKQLPPTVLSDSAKKYGYDQSLFVRMQKNSNKDVFLLDQQYRMHPAISIFPSKQFYDGLLTDGDNMAQLRKQPWHQTGLLGPYRFFDVTGNQAAGAKGRSYTNKDELKVAMQLYERFRIDNPQIEVRGKIGIITPYKAQLVELRTTFSAKYGQGILEEIEFNTTDAFQGRECEIIIFSCVRASPTGGIGFMNDVRRMNVGLTRAKSSLWILGDSRALAQGPFWKKLLDDAQERNLYTSGNIMAMLRKPGDRLPPPVSPPVLSASRPTSRDEPMVSPGVHRPPKPDFNAVEDIDMKDAPPRTISAGFQQRRNDPQPSPAYIVHEKKTSSNVFSNLPQGYSGINELGQPISSPGLDVSERPVIHAGQKRQREPSENGPIAKRAASGPQLNRDMPQRPRPTDPAAVAVMGLEPPQRPQPQAAQQPRPPTNAPKGPKSQPMPPKRKPASGNPMLQRKPNPKKLPPRP